MKQERLEKLKEKANALDSVWSAMCMYNKYHSPKDCEMQITLIGFDGLFWTYSKKVCEDFLVYHRSTNENLIEAIENKTVYVNNPSAVRKYFNQKWYRMIRNLV